MRWQWSIEDGQRVEDVVVEADADVSIEAVAEALDLPVAAIAPGAAADAPAGDVAPVSGSVLPLRHWDADLPGFAVRFRGGPLAGHIATVGGTNLTLGRSLECTVPIADPAVSRRHATVTGDRDALRLTPLPGAAPVRVNGAVVEVDGVLIGAEDVVELGASVLSIGPFATAAADIARDGSGELAFNRPSRIRAYRPENRIVLPGPRPEEQERAPLPWAMATVPVVMAGVLAFVSKQPTMLMMGAASPAMVFANYRTQRRSSSRRGANTLQKWQAAVVRTREQVEQVTDSERRSAWRELPDPASIREICRRPDNRLWERRRDDPDALSIRLGVAEVAVPLKQEGQPVGDQLAPPAMSPVPVAVDLGQAGVLGIAGPTIQTRSLGRWALLQLAALRSPRDLRIVVLCESNAAHAWEFVRWLPHTRVDVSGAPAALVGNSEQTRVDRVRELMKEIEARQAQQQDNRELEFDEQVVVLVDGARRYRTLPGMSTVLRDGPAVGVHAICLDDDRSRLPEEARAELIVDAADRTLGRLEAAGLGAVTRVLLDGVSPEIADEAARAMAPVRHVGGDGDSNVLPTAVRFVDLLGVDLEDPAWVATRWTVGGRDTRAVVGAGVDGPFALDLRADGPHALVAGTTGAGKSEFLQTWVVSLALANRPDSLTFVLVDYKGASAFADCERLPHTVGMVTNLDNRETERALTSLDAELKRRETVLRAIGAKDVDDAWDRDPIRSAADGLARLVIVIDEFAELVHELPDFVTGLIRIARVGRSLGVHLVLATQRPAGVVNAEMQANVGLRVALRMVDKGDSTEVLGSPEAAFIAQSTPGRGYVRRGPGNAPDGFQTARVAGRRPGAHSVAARRPVVAQVPWHALGEPLTLRRPRSGGDDPTATDLHALVSLIDRAATSLGLARNPSPWLPALPELVTVDSLASADDLLSRDGNDPSTMPDIVLGLRDVPSEQSQSPLVYSLADGEHLLVAGSARSGRSTVLRTLIAGLVQAHGPQDLHLYCIDFGNGALLPARDLPHCGAVVSGSEPARFVRLLGRLAEELSRRQAILASDGFGDIAEQRAAGAASPLPYIVVVIDRWEGVVSAFAIDQLQELRDRVVKVLREGPAVGVRVVVTGDQALLTDRIAGFIETRYLLRMADRDDYRLANIRPQGLPETIPPGRAYYGEPTNEAQFAVLSQDVSGQGQAAALRAIVSQVSQRDTALGSAGAVSSSAGGGSSAGAGSSAGGGSSAGVGSSAGAGESFRRSGQSRPFRVDVLPPAITLSSAAVLPEATAADRDFSILVGVGGDELSQYRADFSAGPGFLVAGQRRTGRSTALATAATTLAQAGVDTLVIAPKPSPLSEWAVRGERTLVMSTDAEAAQLVTDWVASRPRCAVLVDDADLVHGTDLDSALIDLARQRPPASLALVVAAPCDDIGTMLRGVAVEARRQKQGVLLSPGSSLDGNALGSGLPRQLLGRAAPGRAVYLVHDEWTPIQLPLLDAVSVG